MRLRKGQRWQRRGASLILAASSLLFVVGVGALAVDLGMLYKARADALYAAEAGALAGASAFMDFPNPFSSMARQEAADRAREYAMRNRILNNPVTAGEVGAPEVIPESLKVRLRVGREGIGTWFARMLGEESVPVGAGAAAAVEEGDNVDCVSPFMIPDTWDENDQDIVLPNRWEDTGEDWTFNQAEGDQYDQAGNGFGSDHRNGLVDESNDRYESDFGREMILRPSQPAPGGGPGGTPVGRTLNTWDFWAFDDEDPELEEAVEVGECREGSVGMGQDFELITDESAKDAVRQRLHERMLADNSTRWDHSTGSIISGFPDWRSSPRVIKVGIYNPEMLSALDAGATEVPFTNVALFLLEGVDADNNITGRFLYYVTGSGSGDDTEAGGSLVKHVRLVE